MGSATSLLKPGQLATPAAFKSRFVEKGNPFSPRNRERSGSCSAR
jgi:hypothetical protein